MSEEMEGDTCKSFLMESVSSSLRLPVLILIIKWGNSSVVSYLSKLHFLEGVSCELWIPGKKQIIYLPIVQSTCRSIEWLYTFANTHPTHR